jgi:intein-encoded DNA endonuclease-like protein
LSFPREFIKILSIGLAPQVWVKFIFGENSISPAKNQFALFHKNTIYKELVKDFLAMKILE